MYICEKILVYIQRLLLVAYNKDNNCNLTIENVNNSNLLKGIYECLLESIIAGTLTVDDVTKYINSYLKKVNNKKDRHFSTNCPNIIDWNNVRNEVSSMWSHLIYAFLIGLVKNFEEIFN